MCDALAMVVARFCQMSLVCWALAAAACAGSPPPTPARPQSSVAREWQHRLGGGVRDCGESVQDLDDRSCSLQRVHECLHAALGACAPARGVHLYSSPEGDSIRVDYFVAKERGACILVVVEDQGGDPVGNKGIVTRSCRTASWRPQRDAPGCQVLDPVDCAASN